MAEWVECTIGDLCNTISDTYKGKDEYVVLINTSDVLEGKVMNHETVANKNLKGQFKKTFKKDDILYSEIRPANKRFAFVDFENTSNYIASTKLMVLRHNDTVLPEYLFALLKSNCVIDELQHLAETRSGTFPQITFSSELASMRVFLPDRETQKRIVSVLSSIEKKIDNNLVINNNLPPHPCYARIAAKQRRQTPKTDECLHTDGKVSDRGGNEETAEQFSSLLAA
ncbi:restriction endonuclease subunit S [Lachnoanaerobaculum orale]|uniref:Restriction endonuclease subunit S n=1 Tax=Lachnoanaerobaculum orale TaxID=979627 RepID=A0A3P3Q6P3_9FIRM|nr:restriction endonuclease subunit S [Lachnoanaerobaculum orale]RRJ16897.1 restriction endonuclease subunit S [Lachnoanaerobaculum orale]